MVIKTKTKTKTKRNLKSKIIKSKNEHIKSKNEHIKSKNEHIKSKNEHIIKSKYQDKKIKFTRKHRTTKGGGPKINFAYVYFAISYDDYISLPNIAAINTHFVTKDTECNCRAVTAANCPVPDVSKPFISPGQELIIVMKYLDILKIQSDKNQLLGLLNEILGHAIIDYNHKPLVCIFSVCLEKTEKVGYGAVIFNTILTYLEFKYQHEPDVNIWLAVDLLNTQFSKVAYIYVSAGFKNPFLTISYPFGNYSRPLLSLSKHLHEFTTDESSTKVMYDKIIDLYTQWQTTQGNSACKILFTFDKTVILRGRQLPYLIITDLGKEINPNKAHPAFNYHHEYAGSFKIYNSSRVLQGGVDRICYNLSFSTIKNQEGLNTGIEYEIGTTSSVEFPPVSYSYHVHPLVTYRQANVLIAPPSGSDFQAFMNRFLFYTAKDPAPTLFHSVFTLEGIYIISLHPDFINYSDHVRVTAPDMQVLITKFQIYEYPYVQRYLDWNTNNDWSNPLIVSSAISTYFDWFSKRNKEILGIDIFYLFYVSWKDLDKNTKFDIPIPKIYGNCFTDSNDYNSIKYVLPNGKNYVTPQFTDKLPED
jgi:hypothetical protein